MDHSELFTDRAAPRHIYIYTVHYVTLRHAQSMGSEHTAPYLSPIVALMNARHVAEVSEKT